MFKRILLVLASSIAAAALAPSPFANLFFEPNHGQSPARVRYLARTPGAAIAFEAGGVRLRPGGEPAPLRFPGAKPGGRLEPLDPTPDRSFYLLGSDRSRWTSNVPHYRRLAWRGVYPGVDVVLTIRDTGTSAPSTLRVTVVPN
jgi:hypothetical protein